MCSFQFILYIFATLFVAANCSLLLFCSVGVMSCVMKIMKLVFTCPCVQFFSNYQNGNEYNVSKHVMCWYIILTGHMLGIEYAIISTNLSLTDNEEIMHPLLIANYKFREVGSSLTELYYELNAPSK